MLLDLESFTWIDWLISIVGLFIAGSSAAAAWYGAIISRQNQKKLDQKSKVSLRVVAEHHKKYKLNTTRDIADEVVRVRLFNEGRQIEVEGMILLLEGLSEIPLAFADDFDTLQSGELLLEHHKSYVMTIFVKNFLELEQIAVIKKPLRLFLKDGDKLDFSIHGIRKIMQDLSEFKSDLNNGYEILLPNVFVYSGSHGWSIEKYEGKRISAELEIREQDSKEPVAPEDEVAWREGRNPQKEQVAEVKEQRLLERKRKFWWFG
tara:strand:- start:28776 stop:29561 length:786 start_codon:yes stop_codon:yes gene_type:complete